MTTAIVTQQVLQVLESNLAIPRVTQQVLEVVVRAPSGAVATQQVLEVITYTAPPPNNAKAFVIVISGGG
jgi:hypothetical protein